MEVICCNPTKGEGLLFQNNSQKPLDYNIIKRKSNSVTEKRSSYENNSHAARTFEVLNSLRNDAVFCDIKLETDDGSILHGHKVILASATPYFYSMFINFEESKKEQIILREVDSTALKLLLDFIYTGQIMVTEDNVQDLLYAASLIQLDDVKDACCDYLQNYLNCSNCLGFKALVSLYDCKELLWSFESFIQQNFLEVVEGDEFLCLSYEQVIELISCNTINVPSEEKVFECVVRWMNHNSDCKKDVLHKLMKHVRLQLLSKEYVLNKMKEIPLLNDIVKVRNYIRKADKSNGIPITIGNICRKPVSEIILTVGYKNVIDTCLYIEWFDPVTNRFHVGPKITIPPIEIEVAIFNDQTLFMLDCSNTNLLDSLNIPRNGDLYRLDLFSPPACLKKIESLLKLRILPGVAVIFNCIYIIGGMNKEYFSLNTGEVFNLSTQKEQMIMEMSTPRFEPGVGVLNNHLYAIGGANDTTLILRSVERYCPSNDTWTPVAEMSESRCNPGVGVLNGLIYAVGGQNPDSLNSVEVYNPSSNVWTAVSSMHKCRINPKVVPLNGLLYVVGGDSKGTVEIYNPSTDNWSMLPVITNIIKKPIAAGLINKPLIPKFYFNYL